MSKKHYIMLAKVLSENKAPFQLCSDLAIQFKSDNRLFDINRFLTACFINMMDKVILPIIGVVYVIITIISINIHYGVI